MDASRQAPATPVLMQGFPPPPQQRVLWSNWLRPSFNRWSLQHLDQLRPTLAVRAGWGPRAAWVAGPDRLVDYRFQDAQGDALDLAQHLQDSYTDGFLVLKDDQVLCERYFNGQTPDSRHIMFSVTKSMAVAGAGFAATLQDMGRFGQLLAHRGSLPDGRPLLDPAVIDALTAGGDAALYAQNRDFSEWTPGASYRSQWYVFRDGRPALMAGGIHGQYLYVDPAARLVVVKQSSLPSANTAADIDTVRLLRSLGEYFAD